MQVIEINISFIHLNYKILKGCVILMGVIEILKNNRKAIKTNKLSN